MATWSDIEPVLDKLEQLDKATLEAFASVMPPPSDNPSFRHRFDQAQLRIRRRLDQFEADEMRSQKRGDNHSDEHWYKKPVGIVVLSVTAGLLLLLIKFLLGF